MPAEMHRNGPISTQLPISKRYKLATPNYYNYLDSEWWF